MNVPTFLQSALSVLGLARPGPRPYHVLQREGPKEIRHYPATEGTPERTVAVLRYRGNRGARHRHELLSWLHRRGDWHPVSDVCASTATTLLAKHEVLVEVIDASMVH